MVLTVYDFLLIWQLDALICKFLSAEFIFMAPTWLGLMFRYAVGQMARLGR